MIIKTAELIGRPLDWAVATADARTISYDSIAYWVSDDRGHGVIGPGIRAAGRLCGYSPSTQGGDAYDIIEREGIATRKDSKGVWYAMMSADLGDGERASWAELTAKGGERYGVESWAVHKRQQRFKGETPLIAAMRAYVAKKLGREVDVPEELLK